MEPLRLGGMLTHASRHPPVIFSKFLFRDAVQSRYPLNAASDTTLRLKNSGVELSEKEGGASNAGGPANCRTLLGIVGYDRLTPVGSIGGP